MWIVRLALKSPYTFVVMAVTILLVGILTIVQMPTDIFPEFDMPVITTVWSYPGFTPNDMEKRFVTVCERAYTTTVNGIQHTESQSVSGVGIVKVYFQPGTDISQALAQVTAVAQAILRTDPPGTTPPLILRYDASDVPVLEAMITSKTESQQSIYDYAMNFIRTQLATVRGAQLPSPYGGLSPEVNVDLNLQKLAAHGVTPYEVSQAFGSQNIIVPTGDAKIGALDYTVQINSSPDLISELNNLPIKTVSGAVVTVKDIGQVRQGYVPQTNIVDEDGHPAILLTVLRSGGASTIDVVNRVKAALPGVEATLPTDIHVHTLADQSIFVKASIDGVIKEASIAACLTALMILLFLGSLRSTMIVAVSIPLSILTSIIILGAIGETLNIMTLGGLALAVGILVDDTTVTIENINRNMGLGLPLRRAIIVGAREIALPALVSTLSICIVFLPVFLLTGAARSLFVPLALAVIFAMLASYLLSRTVTPTFAAYLLRDEVALHQEDEAEIEDDPHSPDYADFHRRHEEVRQERDKASAQPAAAPPSASPANGADGDQPHTLYQRHEMHKRSFDEDAQRLHESAEKIKRGIVWRIHARFNRWFGRMRGRYVENLRWTLEHRIPVLIVFTLFCILSFCITPFVGRDFFPSVDAGTFRLHARLQPGTRIEDTAEQFAAIEQEIHQVVPQKEIALVLDNIGEPSSINLAFGDSATVGPSDGEIDVSLNPGHAPTAGYERELRRILPEKFPQDEFFFQPADIVSQILNFGLPAPIDIQISGPNLNRVKNFQIAQEIQSKVSKIPGAVDVHIQQVTNYPELLVNVNREQAAQINLTQASASDNLLISLASSGLAAPNFWLNQKNGVNYTVAVQTPQYRTSSIDDILNTPIGFTASGSPELLGSVATVTRTTVPEVIDHYNIQPVYDVYATNQDRDLGGVADDINKVLGPIRKRLPRGSVIVVAGQVASMNSSFAGLGFGIIGAIVLVYLLLAVNFQSWLDPLVVVSGAPGALSGILWMLFATQTTLNVPSLMGAIMSIGVSTANSVLLITFANDRRLEGMSSIDAAVAAGYTRLRPILMTALAMIIGMVPMALGLGEGGEQNAPLGRAVIGGLLVATFTTLFIVPVTYSYLRKHQADPIDDSDLYLTEDEGAPPAGRRNGAEQNGRNGNGYHEDGDGRATAGAGSGYPRGGESQATA